MSLPRAVSVIGAGQMGIGIAFVAALRAKVPQVLVYDRSEQQLTKGLAFIDKLLAKDVSKGKISEADAKDARARVSGMSSSSFPTSSSSSSSNSDIIPTGFAHELTQRGTQLVVEAAPESLRIKSDIFRALASSLAQAKEGKDVILASNTSSISITKLAQVVAVEGEGLSAASEEGKRSAGRVVGLHFFNPVPVMKLVELIPALQTTTETMDKARAFAVACGKEVTTSKDVPGFVANALLMPYINEAIMCLEQGTASRDDIDKTMKLGMNHPMGPLELADFIGLDTCLAIQQTLYNGTSDSKYRPSILLERMVSAGWVGKKGGKGFYEY